jgi:hypothetical protein
MKTGILLVLLGASLSADSLLQPPPLIRITQAAGVRSIAGTPTADPAAGVYLFGLTSLTGPAETWLIETHSSFAALEQFDNGGSPRNRYAGAEDAKTLVAFHRQWWSHRPDEAVQALRKARYFQISLYRTGVSAQTEFAELLRARKASLDSINLDRPDLVYQVIAGAPSGTFLVLSPLPSLQALDDGVSRSAAAYLRSTGTPSSRTTGAPRPGTDLSHENLIFRVEPGLSHVSREFAEPDINFWRPR